MSDRIITSHFRITTNGIINLVRNFIRENDLERARTILECCGVLDFSSKPFVEKLFNNTHPEEFGKTKISEKKLEFIADSIEQEIRDLQESIELAQRLSNELSDTIGGDWEPKIWFNSHWHYSSNLGSISVSECETDTASVTSEIHYLVSLSNKKGVSNNMPEFWLENKEYIADTPKEAVEKALEYAKSIVNSFEETLKENNNLIKKN